MASFQKSQVDEKSNLIRPVIKKKMGSSCHEMRKKSNRIMPLTFPFDYEILPTFKAAIV